MITGPSIGVEFDAGHPIDQYSQPSARRGKIMGFQRRKYKLVFEGVYEGLEVSVRGAAIGEYVEVNAITSLGSVLFDGDHADERARLVEILAGKLLGWNLVDDEAGEDVPCTGEQLVKEDMAMLLDITKAWIAAGFAVSSPLASPSGAGAPPEGMDIPMDLPMEVLG